MSPFFAGIAQRELSLRGHPARAPLFYRDAALVGGVFTADLAAARAFMPTPCHHALSLGGRALVAVHCLEYRQSDIGPYGEVSIAVAAVHGRAPLVPAARILTAILADHYHAHVVALPVTTEVALWGGLDVFGYPKYLATTEHQESAGERICRLLDRESGALILEARGARLPTRCYPQLPGRLRRLELTTYPRLGGATLRARLVINLQEAAFAYGRAHLELALGAHPRAEVLRRLRLGRQLQHLYAPRCQAILHFPEKLDG